MNEDTKEKLDSNHLSEGEGPCNGDFQQRYWQSSVKTLKSKIAYAHSNQMLVDVGFLVGPTETFIPANKTILSLQSPVLEAMFSGRWRSSDEKDFSNGEGDGTDTKVLQIKIPDIQPITFRSFLKFLYTEELETTSSNVSHLLYTSKKYQVEDLTEACFRFVRENICVTNCLWLLEDAIKICDPILEQIATDFVCRNAFEVVTSENFLQLDQTLLANLLERQDFSMDEVLLFKNIWRWAKNECARKSMEPNNENCRQVLGRAFTSIRFLQMNAEDFATNVANLKVLSPEEEIEILRYLTLPKNLRQTPETGLMLSLTQWPRKKTKETYIVTRIQKSEPRKAWATRSPNSSYNHCVSINRPAALISCGFFGPLDRLKNTVLAETSYTVCLSLKNLDCDFTYASVTKTVVLEPSVQEDIFHVLFENPVPLTPGAWYTISFTIKGPPTLGGNDQPKYSITIDKNRNDPVIIKFKDASAFNMRNQVPELCFEW